MQRAVCYPERCSETPGLRYICKQVYVRTETDRSPFTQALTPGQKVLGRFRIGHMERELLLREPDTLAEL